MPKSKYEDIYKDLKRKIETGTYENGELLPSEHRLIVLYDCSRNTIRRALSRLVSDGYVQSIQGLGVRNIYTPVTPTMFTLGGIETFRESAEKNKKNGRTQVVLFTELTVDEKLAARSLFPVGEQVYYLQRVHLLDDMPLILNHNYFLKEAVPGLTAAIAAGSIYDYLENTLHMVIVNSRRIVTVEKITEIDEKYLHLDAQEYNCMAVVTSFTYDSRGTMFEYTQSRHRPDSFCFQDNAVR